LNPNRFSSFATVESLIEKIVTDPKEPRIQEVHFNVDLRGVSYSEIKPMIRLPRSRVSTRVKMFENINGKGEFSTEMDFSSSQHPETVYLGSKKSNHLVCYEKITLSSIRSLKEKMVRIEFRFRKPKRLQFIDARNEWIKMQPFERVRFIQVTNYEKAKPGEILKLEYHRLLSSSKSPREADQWFKKILGANSHRTQRLLKKYSVEKSFDLHRIYHRRLKRFLAAKPNADESAWLF